MEYLTREGIPCPYGVWSEMLSDRDYREIQSDDLPNGTKVETCWLGVDGRSFYLRPPRIRRHLIFYTVVTFAKKEGRTRENRYFRYATEREARVGHRAAVRKYRLGTKKTASPRR